MAAIAGTLAMVTAVLWATGGLNGRPTGPEKVAAGRPIDQGRFVVTLQSARIRQEKESFSDKQKRLLVVRMHITSHDKESASLSVQFMTGFTGVPKPGTYLEPDDITGLTAGGDTGDVHPGLPIDAEAIWELPPGDNPRQITVALRQWEFGHGFTILEEHWSATRSSPIMATVTLPVEGS